MTARLIINERRLTRQAAFIQSKAETIAVVKNDGYNHGLERIFRTFYKGGIRAFATTSLSEAIQLRKWQPDIFILLLDPNADFQRLKEYNITVTLSSYAFYESHKKELTGLPLQLVYRNDLNRLGFTRVSEMKKILDDPDMNVNGIWTHFASADEFGIDRYEKEVKNWQAVLDSLASYIPSLTYIHAQNSASFLRSGLLPEHTHIRGGVLLYGTRPYCEGLDEHHAEQAVSVEAHVIELTKVKAGQAIGYSAEYTADKDMTIAVCDIGYGNGLLTARQTFPVTINQKSFPIRVMMMSHLLVEVDDTVNIGATVILYDDTLRFDWLARKGIGAFSKQMASLNRQTFDLTIIK